MKTPLVLFCAALLAVTGFAAEPLPLFNATLTVGKEHRFVLVSQPDGKSSGFLALGQSFDGYTLKSYDAPTSTLDLEKDGRIVHVTLVGNAAVADAPGMQTPATLADAEAVMNKIHIEDLLERTIAQQKKMIASMLQRNVPANVPANLRGDVAAFQQQVMDEVGKLMDPARMKDDITKIYSETFSKEELDQISAFYDTPLGQTLLAKQPEIQQKMQQVMLPRMAEIGPKLQQMNREFAAEMRAKRAAAAPTAATTAPAPGSTP